MVRFTSRTLSGSSLVAAAAVLATVAGAPSAHADASTPGTAHRPGEVLVQGATAGAVVTPAGTVSVTRGHDALSVAGLAPGRAVTLSLPSAAVDVQVRHSLTLPQVDAASIGLYESTQLRHQDDGDTYRATVVVRGDGALSLNADRVSGGVQETLARVKLSTRAEQGRRLIIESRVAGTTPVTLLARAWTAGSPRPGWELVADDSSPARITASGAVGLRAYLSRSGTTTPFTVSALRAWSMTSPPDGSVPSAPGATPTAGSDPTPLSSTPPSSTPPSSTPPSSTPPSSTPATTPPASLPAGTSTADPSASAPGSTLPPAGSSPGFRHPGVLDGADQLAFVRTQIAAGRQPWTSALSVARHSRYGSLSWQPHPVASVGCGAHTSPDEGCSAETDDAQAAYTDALLWSLTGDDAYAAKGVQILDSWSGTLREHRFDTTLYTNGRLQAAWAGETFTKAAELLRSSSSWDPAGIDRFQAMLTSAFLPMVRDGWTGGAANWELSMAAATMDIGVFTDDRSVFDQGVAAWRHQVPAAIYLSSDGPAPVVPFGTVIRAASIGSYWRSPTRFVDGLEQETCRDQGHMALGMAAALSGAETAWLQGVDLYGEQQQRLVTGMEYNTRYLNHPGDPGWVCPAPPLLGGALSSITWEVGYHHYADVEGMEMPQTRTFLLAHRPTATALDVNWETLTHAGS